MFYPSLHLLAFVCDYLPTRLFEGEGGGRLALGRTQCLLNAIVHSPDVPCYGGCLYILAELRPILICTSPHSLLNLAPGSSENLQVPFAGWLFQCLYSIRAVHLASMTDVISDDLASNQSGVLEVVFPKVARAMRCMVSQRISHFSVAESLGCGAPNSLMSQPNLMSQKPLRIVT